MSHDDAPPDVWPAIGGRLAAAQGLLAFADQGVVSLANFACSIFVARAAGEVELGLYGLGFMVFVLLLGLAKALIWTPYTSLCARLHGDERRAYDGSVTVHFAAFMLAASLALLALGAAAYALLPQKLALARLFMVLAPCLALVMLREHVRKLCLARLCVVEVLAFDVVVSGLQMLAIVWLYQAGRLTGAMAFVGSAAACCLSLPWFYYRRARFAWKPTAWRLAWAKNWDIARWITPNAAMSQIGNQVPRWFLEALYGLREVGLFMSAQTVIQTANPLLLGNANYFGPNSARVYAAEGKPGLRRVTVRNTLFLCALVIAVALAAALLGPTLIPLVFGRTFQVPRGLILSLSLGMLSEVLLMPIEFATLTVGRARVSTAAGATRLAINLSLGLALVYLYGSHGIGYALFVGNSVALAWLWTAFLQQASAGGERPLYLRSGDMT
jgi:O-antigen/teichoic acid export membrane protein